MTTISSDKITLGDGTSFGSPLTSYAINTHIVAAVAATSSETYGNYVPFYHQFGNGTYTVLSGSVLYVENGSLTLDSNGYYLAYGTSSVGYTQDIVFWGNNQSTLLTICPQRIKPGNDGWQPPVGNVTTLPGTWVILSKCPGSRSYYNSGISCTQTFYPTALFKRIA